MMEGSSNELITCLRTALGPSWDFQQDGGNLSIRHVRHSGGYRPPRRFADWPQLLERLTTGFASCGVERGRTLPMRWKRDTDFTISAIQALDPYLKDAKPITYSQGFLPQPAAADIDGFGGCRRQPTGE